MLVTDKRSLPEHGALVPARSVSDKAQSLSASFRLRFERGPAWMAMAPGRVNVIGEHVDYCEGLVLPMAIDRHVLAAAAPTSESVIRVVSRSTDEEAVIPLDRPIDKGEPAWSNYVRGVVHGFVERGIPLVGLNVFIDSDLPMGGGLSSSAALEVATATLLESAVGRRMSLSKKALLCQQAEQDFAGVPCGIMDQFASVHGREHHLLLIDCRTEKVKPVPMQDAKVAFMVINTNVRHELGHSEYPLRRASCEEAARRLGLRSLRDATLTQMESTAGAWPESVRRCARHVITEISRVLDTADATRQGDWRRVGDLMRASHASLRDDFRVSCSELDLVVQLTEAIGPGGGVYGCRMTGAGFGGCCVALVELERAAGIARNIDRQYAERTGVHPTLFMSRPSQGACALHSGDCDLPPQDT